MGSLRLSVCVFVLCSGVALADMVTLPATQDNTLYEDASGLLSNGAGQYIFAGNTASGTTRRALIAFDIAANVPAGATINSVTLTLNMSKTIVGPQTVSTHRTLMDWGEGASAAGSGEGGGGPAMTGDATWIHTFFNTSFWTTIGGDFVATASASTSVDNVGPYTWSSAQMAADVQAWLDTPASNFGWMLIGNEAISPTAKRFDSRTNFLPSAQPTLDIDFTPPAGSGACCATDGTCAEVTSATCSGQSGNYQGDGTSCTPNPCPQPGACCLGNGTCSEELENDCILLGGSYQGAGTTCAGTSCPGACCLSGGQCSETTLTDCTTQGGTYQAFGTTCTPGLCPVTLTPYVDALPLPAVAQPVTGVPGGAATYHLSMTQFEQQLHSELAPTTLWGYGGSYPGPTIETTRDLPVTVRWINDLRDDQGVPRTTHLLPVDLCPHGADTLPRTVVHLHGGHVPAEFDGYPEDTFLPGEFVDYDYPNNQLPAMIWYHDHALGITRLNVMLGLAGLYMIRDQVELDLDLPEGEFEVPLVIQDRSFDSDGELVYPAAWQDHFFGDKNLVNGKVWPFFEVKQGKYRFRVLNGANSRVYTLTLSNGASFQQIGTDSGLLPAPVTLNEITLGPAERADLVVDFSAYAPGTEILLTNSAPAPFPGTPGVGVVPEVMKFVVIGTPGFTDPVPAALRPFETLLEGDATVFREFELSKQTEPCAGSVWLINGLTWDDITEFPLLGSTEVWSWINRSGVAHPMHLHLDSFQVLDRQPFVIVDDEVVPTGVPTPPAPEEAGWKDTVQAHPNEITRFIVRFQDYTGLFPYHCHTLEHEDHEMMRQFQVIDNPCGVDCNDPCEFCDDQSQTCEWCILDHNLSGAIDGLDFGFFSGCFGACYSAVDLCADANYDGDPTNCVGTGDFAGFAGCFGLDCASCTNCSGPGGGPAPDGPDQVTLGLRTKRSTAAGTTKRVVNRFATGDSITVELTATRDQAGAALAAVYADVIFDSSMVELVDVTTTTRLPMFDNMSSINRPDGRVYSAGGCAELTDDALGSAGEIVSVATLRIRGRRPGRTVLRLAAPDVPLGTALRGRFGNLPTERMDYGAMELEFHAPRHDGQRRGER